MIAGYRRAMPATVPVHQAAVLPLKLWRPHLFDGVALAVGAATPDAAFVLIGVGPDLPSHAWHALLWFNLPVTLVLAVLVRRAAPTVAAHLPDAGPLHLRDYAVLAVVRHPPLVTVSSALLGAASHLLWDSVTHPYLLVGHPFAGEETYLRVMHLPAFAGLAWWRVIQLVSEVAGLAVAAAVALRIGRRRLLVAWHGPAPAGVRMPLLFWPVVGFVGVALAAVGLALPGTEWLHVRGARVLCAVVLALLAGAAAVGAGRRPLAKRVPLHPSGRVQGRPAQNSRP
jgi:hypothetical protein